MKKLSIVKAIAVLIILFSASTIQAQAPEVVPYPATEHGQRLTITNTNENWGPLMEASTKSRTDAQTSLNDGETPSAKWSCVGNVCCQTTATYCGMHGGYHYSTTCINTISGEELDTN